MTSAAAPFRPAEEILAAAEGAMWRSMPDTPPGSTGFQGTARQGAAILVLRFEVDGIVGHEGVYTAWPIVQRLTRQQAERVYALAEQAHQNRRTA